MEINSRKLMTEAEVSKATGFKESALRKRRHQGKPPRFLKVGSKVLYDANDVEGFMNSCVRECTQQKSHIDMESYRVGQTDAYFEMAEMMKKKNMSLETISAITEMDIKQLKKYFSE